MKQKLLKTALGTMMLWGACTMASAQTYVYGCASGSLNYQMAEFDLDKVNADAETEVTKLFDMESVAEVNAGASLGNKYFAMYTDADWNTCFGSFNFTTGEVVKVKSWSYTDDPKIKSLASYGDKLYGLKSVSGEDAEGNIEYHTELVEVSATGDITTLKSYDMECNYDCLTPDGNGNFYFVHNSMSSDWKLYPSLYKIDGTTYEMSQVFENTTTPGTYSYINSAIAKDGKVYYMANTKLFVLDPEAKTIEMKGQLGSALCGMTLDKSSESATATPDEPKTDMRKLTRTTKYGDAMGTTADATSYSENLYDKDMKLQRVVEYGRQNKDYKYDVTYLTKYNYDDKGNLASTVKYQGGLYDHGDWTFEERSKDTYEYNENNQLVKKSEGHKTTEYTYNEDGTLAKETVTTNGGNTITTTYEDYENGKATTVYTESPWSSTKQMREYTADGKPSVYTNFQKNSDGEYEGTTIEMWNYDETGFLTDDTRYSVEMDPETGMYTPISKTVYEAVDGNKDKVKVSDSTYFSGTWYGGGTYRVEDYTDFTDMTEATSTEVSVTPVEGEKNTVNVNISVPSVAYSNPCKVRVYRDGKILADSDALSLYDENTNTLVLKDSKVQNGTYDYFVQVGTGEMSGEPLAEGEGDTEEPEDEYTYYCVSNVAPYTFDLKLPKVTDLKVESAVKKSVTDPQTGSTYDAVYPTLSWKQPADAADYGFVSNSIYEVNFQTDAANTTDVAADKLEFQIANDMDLFVLTRYEYGKAYSDTIHLKLSDMEDLAVNNAITAAKADGLAAYMTGKTLKLNTTANVTVISVGGQIVAKASGV